jgi:hypothetical protein
MNKNDNGVTGESIVPSSRDSARNDGSSKALLMTSVAEAAASENVPPITCSNRDSIAKVISENPSSAIEIPVSLSCDKPDSSGSLLDEIDTGIDGI